MSSSSDIFFLFVAPSIGNAIVLALFLSNQAALNEAQRTGTLPASLSYIPFCLQLSQCLFWFIYGLLTNNAFVGPLNAFGAIVAMYSLLVVATLMPNTNKSGSGNGCGSGSGQKEEKKERERLVWAGTIALAFPSLLTVILAYLCNLDRSSTAFRTTIGAAAVALNIAYYGSPLSTMLTVIRTRSSESLSVPMCIMVLICSSFWFMYTLALGDFFMFIPQVCGLALSIAQLLLIAIYRKNTTEASTRKALELNESGHKHEHEHEHDLEQDENENENETRARTQDNHSDRSSIVIDYLEGQIRNPEQATVTITSV